jgi:hypothetical protein
LTIEENSEHKEHKIFIIKNCQKQKGKRTVRGVVGDWPDPQLYSVQQHIYLFVAFPTVLLLINTDINLHIYIYTSSIMWPPFTLRVGGREEFLSKGIPATILPR